MSTRGAKTSSQAGQGNRGRGSGRVGRLPGRKNTPKNQTAPSVTLDGSSLSSFKGDEGELVNDKPTIQPQALPVTSRPKRATTNIKSDLSEESNNRQKRQKVSDPKKTAAQALIAKEKSDALEMERCKKVALVEDQFQRAKKMYEKQALRPDLHLTGSRGLDHKLTSASNTSLSVLSDQSEDSPVTTNSDPFEIPAKTSFESENADTSWSSTGISEYKDKEEDNKVEESGEYDGGSMLDEETNGCTLELPPIKSKKKPPPPPCGFFRAEVEGQRTTKPTSGTHPTVATNLKRKETGSDVVDDTLSVKRSKVTQPGGLVPNWRRKIEERKKALDTAPPKETKKETEPYIEGEFDHEEQPEVLAAVHESKPSKITIKLVAEGIKNTGTDVKIAERPLAEMRGYGRQRKYGIAHLPFPNASCPKYAQLWRQSFRPLIILWALCCENPYGMNSLLDNTVASELWEVVYPNVELEHENLEKAVGIIISVAGDILIDWRSSIGSTAMNLVTSFFKERDYDSEDIKEYVEWALTGFNFLYADPEGPVGERGGFRSDFIMNLFAFHISKKTRNLPRSYGHQIGAIGLCAAAIERALTLWESGQAPGTLTKPDGKKKPIPPFGAEWAPRAEAWTTLAKGLEDDHWAEIMEGVTAILEDQGIKTESLTSSVAVDIDEGPDPRTTIDL